MGLINMFKLANDYAKAKSFIEDKKEDIAKAKLLISGVETFVNKLLSKKDGLEKLIDEGKDLIKQLKSIIC